MEENQMKILADALWGYFLEKYLKPYLSDSLCYYMATVTTAPAGGVIGVQRPFDNAITLPYAWSASTLNVGDNCLVIVFGDMSNAFVIGTGDLGEPGIYVTKAGLLQTTGDATDNTMSQDAITDALALKAPIASPALTGIPTAPTAPEGTSTTQIATTEFVMNAIAHIPGNVDVEALTINANGVYTAPEGVAYSPVTVSVQSGAPRAEQTSVFELYNLGMTWPCEAEEYVE